MDLTSLTEGALLWAACSIFVIGVVARFAFFLSKILTAVDDGSSRWTFRAGILARSVFPFHRVLAKKPAYTVVRYVFHICLFVLPIGLSGHVLLLEESRLGLSWRTLPDSWADGMTWIVMGAALYFLIRRTFLAVKRERAAWGDFVLIILASLPFITGYFLAHGSLDSISFFNENIYTIHVICGELMLITAVFLFCRLRIDERTCTGCGSCDTNCLTGTLISEIENGKKAFYYSHYQCIVCGMCMNVCPENAAELRHEISLAGFFQVLSRRKIREVDLAICERCGEPFFPQDLVNKIGKTIDDDYIQYCPTCKKVMTARNGWAAARDTGMVSNL